MTDNVISLADRKPLAEVKAKEEATQAALQAELTEEIKLARDATLDAIDKIRAMVESGRCGGLVILTQELQTNLFCSDLILHRDVIDPTQMFGWAGHLKVLTDEIAQIATMAPVLLTDGTVCDPHEEMMDEGYL